MNEELFKGALVRERRRADRSNQALALVLVGINDMDGLEPPSTWQGVVEALSASKRDTDVLGWFQADAALGVIAPEVPAGDADFVRDFEARVHLELARRLDARTLNRLSVRLHVHAEAPAGSARVDPLLSKIQRRQSRSAFHIGVKRALDIVGSLVPLVLLSPLFLLLALLVKLTSRGPVFFRQTRVGENGQTFTMFKFRSMRVNANTAIHQEYVSWYIKSSGQSNAASGQNGVFKLTNDPRITPIGNFLRRSSLDELPQLWNVLCGSMSLVGPRPPLPYEVEQYKAWHCRRVLEAKPGITGLWQVSGRSRTTFDEMVRLDLRYARTWSLWADLKIILATPRAVLTGKGAC